MYTSLSLSMQQTLLYKYSAISIDAIFQSSQMAGFIHSSPWQFIKQSHIGRPGVSQKMSKYARCQTIKICFDTFWHFLIRAGLSTFTFCERYFDTFCLPTWSLDSSWPPSSYLQQALAGGGRSHADPQKTPCSLWAPSTPCLGPPDPPCPHVGHSGSGGGEGSLESFWCHYHCYCC